VNKSRSDARVTYAAFSIAVISVILSLGWAMLMPIFLNPDEDAHFDYVMTLVHAGRTLSPDENYVDRDTDASVAYLMDTLRVSSMRLDPYMSVPRGYGSLAYFKALDLHAPAILPGQLRAQAISPVPYVARFYPIGYYAIAASVVAAREKIWGPSITSDFFSVRILSVFFYVWMLYFSWRLLSGLVKPVTALLVYLCIAFLPMTQWVFASVQPDALASALVPATLFFGQKLREQPSSFRLLLPTGLLLGGLAATKYQFFAAVAVGLALQWVASRDKASPPKERITRFIILFLPSLTLILLTFFLLRSARPIVGMCTNYILKEAITKKSLSTFADCFYRGVREFLHYFLANTIEFRTFWLDFGSNLKTPIVLFRMQITYFAYATIAGFSEVLAALFFARLLSNCVRLLRVAKLRSWLAALRIASSNLIIVSYLAYTAFLIAFEIFELSEGNFLLFEGRYWLPFILAPWLIAFDLAPRILPRTKLRRALRSTTIALAVALVTISSTVELFSVYQRFYNAPRAPSPEREVYAQVEVHVSPRLLTFTGYAIDLRRAAPAEKVIVEVDHRFSAVATETDTPGLACADQKSLARVGFSARLSASRFSRGTHLVTVLLKTPWARNLVNSGVSQGFFVNSGTRV
jgi:hypothetical protein